MPEEGPAPTKKAAAKKAAAKKAPAKKAAAKKTAARKGAAAKAAEAPGEPAGEVAAEAPAQAAAERADGAQEAGGPAGPPPTTVVFKAPDKAEAGTARRTRKRATSKTAEEPKTAEAPEPAVEAEVPQAPEAPAAEAGEESEEQGGAARRRRRRGGRRRRKGGGSDEGQNGGSEPAEQEPEETTQGEGAGAAEKETQGEAGTGTRRRRRRRRSGEEGEGGAQDESERTVTRVRKARNPEDEITSLQGSTRLEAKKQRRREGREAGRRRAPIVSEAEFLARREAVDRVMVIRQKQDLTQIAVLEDKVLVEHYVARESQTSLIGNVYLGRVQNVLPSMEAAFIDIGKGRNAVLYAGEVNWDSLGAGNGPRKIEQVLKSGQSVLVQVTKDPIGHKGARLTSQVSLPGRFLVYVPDGTTSGISRKLPDTERNRLKTLLKEIVPDTAGVIVRTAAEGASEDELTRDVERLTARWEDIAAKVEKGNAPQLLYGEPDLTLKVVRDLFTEDFGRLVVSGDDAWDMVQGYVEHVAPDLADRLERYDGGDDVFAAYRLDEQIAKALDRKVWLPSGGSLVIDRTEAMTVVDVNTGKFTGSGGNLEETVTKNNLEAAEEIVRQLRLRDIGGIIVVDFIDMVLESNRDLVLRRLVECLGRDRTRHQVAEVTSLGLVQMTRKRIGTGLLEAFSETCDHCGGRGLITHHEPVETKKKPDEEPRRGRRGRGRGKGEDEQAKAAAPSPKDIAAIAKHDQAPEGRAADVETAPEEPEERPEPTPEPTEPTEPTAGRPGAAPETPVETPAETPVAEQPVEPPVEPPAPPRVVTTSRRRVARRPAGPPSGAVAAGDGGAPVDVPAGASTGTPDQPDPGSPDAELEPAAAVHVPVKKKGVRKR